MKVGIVSHDAGGAENISHWAKLQKYQFLFCIEGPAQLVFKRNLGNYKNTDIQDVVRKSDWIICGSSWQSNLEKIAVREAKLHKKKTVVFLDHWVNYEIRFEMNGQRVLPDEIWVGDEIAEKMAKEIFKSAEIKMIINPYFEYIKRRISFTKEEPQLNNNKSYKVLFIGENRIGYCKKNFNNINDWPYTEKEALKYFIENASCLDIKIKEIKIRPHPSEEISNYAWAKNRYKIISQISKDNELFKDIEDYEIIVGCDSMALVIGILCKKIVISSIPPCSEKCNLPFSEIIHLNKYSK